MISGLAAAALLLQSGGAPSCITADERVERVIAAKVRELQGSEYCQFRIYQTLSDVDGDKTEDFLVVFSVEGIGGGGNSVRQFLAVFASSREWQPAIAEVGRRGERVVRSVSLGPGRAIVLETLEYGPSDAMCCPSRKGTLRLAYKDGRIERIVKRRQAK